MSQRFEQKNSQNAHLRTPQIAKIRALHLFARLGEPGSNATTSQIVAPPIVDLAASPATASSLARRSPGWSGRDKEVGQCAELPRPTLGP
jgi:hypothetical protein